MSGVRAGVRAFPARSLTAWPGVADIVWRRSVCFSGHGFGATLVVLHAPTAFRGHVARSCSRWYNYASAQTARGFLLRPANGKQGNTPPRASTAVFRSATLDHVAPSARAETRWAVWVAPLSCTLPGVCSFRSPRLDREQGRRSIRLFTGMCNMAPHRGRYTHGGQRPIPLAT